MTTNLDLTFLVDLREAAGLTQADVARRFGLNGRQSYKSIAAWEQGKSATPRRRSRFIGYLWDDLRLRDDPDHFEACWDTLVARWHWEPLSEQERAELHLPDAPPSSEPQSGGQTTTINTGRARLSLAM
ncbi:MAG: helix-turn-helix transcriptional regulator [Caldilineaceae bacterium]